MHIILGLLATCLLAAIDVHAAPPNDDCTAATPIASLPFSATVDMTTATDAPTDPEPSCTGGGNTVWFAYTASRATTLLFEATGSIGDVELAAFTGGCAAPAEIGCYSDYDTDGTTQLVVPVAAGQTVHLMVSSDVSASLVLNVDRAPFDATPPAVRAAVRSGDPTPVGAAFGSFQRTLMLSSKDLAFVGTTDGIFVDEGAGPVTIALSGDPTPAGGTFATFGIQAVAPGGAVFFHATLNGTAAASGIFARTPGGITPVVLAGDPAPGGGTFSSFGAGIALSPSGGLLAFTGTVTPGGRRLYVAAGGVVAGPVLSSADPHPCGGVVRLTSSATPIMAINDAGHIAAFVAGSSDDGVLQYSAGTWTAVACEDAPTPIGGTFASLGRSVRITNTAPSSAVAYSGRVALPGPDPDAVFLGPVVVAREGDLTATGETIAAIASNVVADVDPSGTVAFQARTSIGDAVLRVPAGSPASIALAEGQPCPAPVGGAIEAIDLRWVDLADDGTIVTAVTCTGGRGIVRIPDVGAPAFVATQADATPAGAGFFLDDPTNEGGTTGYGGGRTGIFQTRCASAGCGPIVSVLQPLTPLPGLPGESILRIDPNGNGIVGGGKLLAVFASTFGTIERRVLLAIRNGALEVVAAEGQTVPGGTAQYLSLGFTDTTSAIPADVGADRSGIAFLANIFDPVDSTAKDAVFLARRGVVTAVARAGDPTYLSGELYSTFGSPLVQGRRVFFRFETSFGSCVLAASSTGQAQFGACNGQGNPNPVPPGGILGDIQPDVIALGGRALVFRAEVDGGSAAECLWGLEPSRMAALACSGILLPGGGIAGAFNDGLAQRLAASNGRVVSAAADVGFSAQGLFAFGKQRVARIATQATPTPLGGFYLFNEYTPSMYSKVVAFPALVDGGTNRSAIFVATLAR